MKNKQKLSILIWAYRRNATDAQVALYARVTVNGERAQISLGKRIDATLWDEKNGVVRKCEHADEFNEHLDVAKGEIRDCFFAIKSEKGTVTAEAVKKKYLGIDIEEEQTKTLLNIYQEHNDKVEALIGKDYSKATWKKFRTGRDKVAAFLKSVYKREDIRLDEIKYAMIEDFELYLKTTDNLSNNSAMCYIKGLLKVIRYAIKKELLTVNPFAAFRCTIQDKEREILNDADLTALKEKALPSVRLEQVRDIFLFCCYTGYAYAEVSELRHQHLDYGLDGELWIFINRTKTDNRSNVLLLPEALELINKYKANPECQRTGKLFPVRSNQKYNDYLKEVADLCGIKVHMTSHIARHTFATTVTLANDVPIESVSSMLGHKSIRTTQIYAKVVQKKLSNDMRALRSKLAIPKNRPDLANKERLQMSNL
jgi:site-specific recombinase XerD